MTTRKPAPGPGVNVEADKVWGVVFPDHYYPVIFLAGGLWILAFVLFCVVYAPILLAPRRSGSR